jgi:hypothetical protein
MSTSASFLRSTRIRLAAAALAIPVGFVGFNATAISGADTARDPQSSASSSGTGLQRTAREDAPLLRSDKPALAGVPGPGDVTDSTPTAPAEGETSSAQTVFTAGESASATISCDAHLHTVDRDIVVQPMSGFSSQAAAYRSYIYSYTTRSGFWTNWDGITAPGNEILMVNLPFELGTNNYAIYMQYSWHDGRSWTSPIGAWQQSYIQKIPYGFHYQSYCTA